ncbi:hypothetical protein Ade02nite_50610 [Paractinoplanes deccanensis]|uniref:Uncharacterized protein n=1 Tax=Paractinoplanes deccanensis TaxID=113561 RepID=A0ABQ3Y8Z1_9ACTN|nr:hypothetical protein [Actinoplanes deccanensis]GID76420.1 hypothetical protein Ade02nite_50610 [Actinoplanes deccanensis]
MMRREVLTRLREGGLRGDRDFGGRNGNRTSDMHIELETADHEEPTWEVRSPGDARRNRLDRRTRAILGIAATAAVVVNAGAAWAYWRITGSATAQAAEGPPVAIALRAKSDLSEPLRPGQNGDLTVTVANENGYPIRITAVAPGQGTIVADPEHRDAGCTGAAVVFTQPRFQVAWEVQRHTVGAFAVDGALSMRADAARACEGATFTVPVQASGVRGNPS